MPLNASASLRALATRFRGVFFRADAAAELQRMLATTGDEDLTNILEDMRPEERLRVFRGMSPVRQGKILNELSEYAVDGILAKLAMPEIFTMLRAVESDFAVDIIQWLPPDRRAKVMADLRKNDPNGLLPLLVFDEESAGGRMKTEVLKFLLTMSVKDVRDMLGKLGHGRLKTHFLYVIDEGEVLVGVVQPLRLLQAEEGTRLEDIMQAVPVSLPASMNQEEVAQTFDEYDATELPVVNAKGKLLGVITADDIFEILEAEYTKDLQAMGGVEVESRITDPVLLSARRRIPWLGVNLVTATMAATVISLFQETIERVVLLAAFMPVVAGIGGNAAQQALAVTIRAFAVGDLHALNTFRAIGKEVLVGTLNGFLAGSAMAALVYAWSGNATLAAIIVASMTLNLFAAGLVGVGIPVVMNWLKRDPAIASTVFVTATTDIFGFFVFLGLASRYL